MDQLEWQQRQQRQQWMGQWWPRQLEWTRRRQLEEMVLMRNADARYEHLLFATSISFLQ